MASASVVALCSLTLAATFASELLAVAARECFPEAACTGLVVVYSEEEPRIQERPPGSVAFVPAVVGLIMAGEVVRDLGQVR